MIRARASDFLVTKSVFAGPSRPSGPSREGQGPGVGHNRVLDTKYMTTGEKKEMGLSKEGKEKEKRD